ncbi:hypothetical protein ANO14919_114810 [Xylariales sp. No.14919]|nr:hypothetical protein F5X98DRAFT_248745 [Xylaria grammica]GAW21954.1 hypothetical protein ANO14919_114810 [Xylariales sp. No.14919]
MRIGEDMGGELLDDGSSNLVRANSLSGGTVLLSVSLQRLAAACPVFFHAFCSSSDHHLSANRRHPPRDTAFRPVCCSPWGEIGVLPWESGGQGVPRAAICTASFGAHDTPETPTMPITRPPHRGSPCAYFEPHPPGRGDVRRRLDGDDAGARARAWRGVEVVL